MVRAGIGIIASAATAISMFVTSACAQTHVVSGQAGILGEWELTATVTKQAAGAGPLWSGPLSLRHIGICSADGPEEKSGEFRMDIGEPVSRPAGQLKATLLIDGMTCAFEGRLTDGYNGVMTCPNRPDVPMMLMIE